MNNLSIISSVLALAVFLLPNIATAASENDPEVDRNGSNSDENESTTAYDRSAWSLNFTPVVLFPKDEYRWGGGADPELKYTLDLGGAYLSAGGRIGAYYAKNLFGMTAMPTLRVMVPLGSMEPYVAVGVGYGWLPKLDHQDLATMARVGFVYRFSKSFSLGLEGTVQEIHDSDFRFPSFGSMVSIDL